MRGTNMRSFLPDSKGGVAVLFGFVVPALIGFTGLAVDASYWLLEKNRLQGAVDGAAIAAAQTLQLDGRNANLTTPVARHFTKIYGGGANTITYTVQSPPASGTNAGNTSAVEVLSQRTQPVYFLSVFGVSDIRVSVRSVANIDSVTDACLLGLSPSDDKAVQITGSSVVDLDCGIASNSSSPEALYLSGSTNVSATGISAVGDIYQSNGATINTDGGPVRTHTQALTDPYGAAGRNLQVPALPTGCTERNLRVRGNRTLTAGRYCGGIDFQSGTVTLSPGVYVIDGGDFSASAQAEISGTGVTIVLTGSGSSYAQLNINGGAAISLHAPTSGAAMNGILFFQDPNAPTYQGNQIRTNRLNGGSSFSLSGAAYFPKQALDFRGGANASITCLQLIGYQVTFSGNSQIAGTCPANSGTDAIRRVSIKLVE